MQVYNFAAGPAMLPKTVMEKAQAEFTNYQNSGSGLMELSHRGKLFEPVLERAKANVRELLNVSDEYEILFIQGGASLQFSMLAMNFLNGGVADYIDTGVWSAKAIKEAKMFGTVNVVASSKETKYDHIPAESEWKRNADAAYLHITSNNTIAGTRYAKLPTSLPGVPMLADMSSDIMSRPFNMNDFAMVYAGAQKNLGPSGLALVILRKDLAARTDDSKVPTMLRYSTYIEENSMFNTPPTFAIYMLALVTDWLKAQGGLKAMEKINDEKAAYLYNFLDNSKFYASPVAKADRSIMNIVFRTPNEELDAAFVKEAKENGLTDLKGHRLVGGCRASIYNAMPVEGVKALVEFMKKFELARK